MVDEADLTEIASCAVLALVIRTAARIVEAEIAAISTLGDLRVREKRNCSLRCKIPAVQNPAVVVGSTALWESRGSRGRGWLLNHIRSRLIEYSLYPRRRKATRWLTVAFSASKHEHAVETAVGFSVHGWVNETVLAYSSVIFNDR